MKRFYLILIILFSFINSLNEEESASSDYYSKLLKTVRKDVVDKSLLYLPKKADIDILKMVNKMKEAQEEYSLNDAESAYLIYKWISTNYDIEYSNKENSPSSVYKLEKSSPIGLSALFNFMCTHLNIESDSISGQIKSLEYGINIEENLITEISSTWNYIVIDDTNYLVDVSMGAGYFNTDIFRKEFSDLYFGTNPEIFIYSHFPKDNKWQLLSKVYTNKQFVDFPYTTYNFFLNGIKTFSPISQEIEVNGKSEITFNYDKAYFNSKSTLICAIIKSDFTQEDLDCKTSYSDENIKLNFEKKISDYEYLFILEDTGDIEINVFIVYKLIPKSSDKNNI